MLESCQNNQYFIKLALYTNYITLKLSQIIIYKLNLNNQLMLPVKPNNFVKSTRPNTRKNPKQKQIQPLHGKANGHLSKRKDLRKNGPTQSAIDTSDTGQQLQQTINAGLIKNKNNDGKTTVRKINFQNKPVIKELGKRLNSYSKQFVPEYFTKILEYSIQKQLQNTVSPTSDKISKWRFFIQRQRQIQIKVARQLSIMNNMIITSRKKLKQQIKRQRKKYQHINQSSQDEIDNEFDQLKNQANSIMPNSIMPNSIMPNSIMKIKKEKSVTELVPSQSQCSQACPSIQNHSCPQIQWRQGNQNIEDDQKIQEQLLSDEKLNKLWNTRFDKFATLIDTVYELIGQYQCTTTIFPICYIFYSIATSDPKTFQYLDKNYNQQTIFISSTQSLRDYNRNECKILKSNTKNQSFNELSPIETIEYYIIVSILIGTKYYEVYPASLIDLIQSVNYSLSFEKAIKIQGQVLQILNFCQFFNENQSKFLKMFGIVVGWTNSQINVCQFILESGLNNPKLYAYSPLYKAAVVMGIYQQKFVKTQEKFMVIRNLCPGLTLDLVSIIKKEYLEIIVYNNINNFTGQRKKFFIFQNQMKTLTKGLNNL